MQSIPDKFQHHFNDLVREKGDELFLKKKILFYEAKDNTVIAEISDGNVFDLSLKIKGKHLYSDCSCSTAYCSHIWALLCAVEKFGDLPKVRKRSVNKELKSSSTPDNTPTTQDVSLDLLAEDVSSYIEQKETVHNISKTNTINTILKKLPSNDEPQIKLLYRINIFESKENDDRIVLTVYWQNIQKDKSYSVPLSLDFLPNDYYESELDKLLMRKIEPYFFKQGKLQSGFNNVFNIPANLLEPFLECLISSKSLCWGANINDNDFNFITDYYHEPPFIPREIGNKVSGTFQCFDCDLHISETLLLKPMCFAIFFNKVINLSLSDSAYAILKQINEEQLSLFDGYKVIVEKELFDIEPFVEQQGFRIVKTFPIPQVCFRTAKYKYKGNEQLHATLNFIYNTSSVQDSSKQVNVVDYENKVVYKRDRELEQKYTEELLSLGMRYNKNPQKEEIGWKLLPKKLDQLVADLLDKSWEVLAHGKSYIRPTNKELTISYNLDWLELKGEVKFDDVSCKIPELLKLVKDGEKFIVLDDGTRGILPVEWLIKFTALSEIGELGEASIKFKKSQEYIINELIKKSGVVVEGVKLKDIPLSLRNKQLCPIEPQSSFKGKLRPYQALGLAWLKELEQVNLSGCLADDMGLGKTIQVLALLSSHLPKNDGNPNLIVAPKSLIFNWEIEIQKFLDDSVTVYSHIGTNRDKTGKKILANDIVLITYGTLIRDIEMLSTLKFNYMVLDESQAIKNINTNIAKSVRLIDANHRLTMTGTPIENNISELFAQLDFLNPGLFGKNTAALSKKLTESELQTMKETVAPYILRRTKKEVLKELPDKVEQVIYCELSDFEERKYAELKEYYQREVTEEDNPTKLLEALLRLRQASSHLGLLNDEYKYIDSSKISLVMDMLYELIDEGHKVLIFSQFTSLLKIVRNKLENENILYSYIDGSVKDRSTEVEKFQDDKDFKVFLISLKAGGVGLNLTAANYVFILDPWWNPAAESQAIDRAYRMGQKNKVFAYKFITKNTVEEKVLEMQNLKRELSNNIIENNENIKFNKKQLKKILDD